MPFRKLPVTDSELNSAMLNLIFAYDARVTNQPDVTKRVQAFSPETYDRLILLRDQFKKEVMERISASVGKTGLTMLKRQAQVKLKKHVDHFFMVMNLAIDRGVLQPTVRAYYGLDVNSRRIPLFSSHNLLSMWARNIISGETQRIAQGGVPMQCPSLAEVQAAYEDYKAIHGALSSEKSNFYDQQGDVQRLRKAVKAAIRDAWDEIEFYFRKESPSSLRNYARRWGITYGTRKGEKPEESNE